MNMIPFGPRSNNYDVAILIKQASFDKSSMETNYVNPLHALGIPAESIVGISLEYGQNNKVNKKQMTEYIEYIKLYLSKLNIQYLLCADSSYYKELTGQKKAETNLDKAVPCTVKGLEHIKVIYMLNYASLIYNPAQQDKIDMAIDTLVAAYNGATNNIKLEFTDARYPTSYNEIKAELERLHQYPSLAIDIEAFSLKLGKAGIASICFCESQTAGTAFLVDYKPCVPTGGLYGNQVRNEPIRRLLKEFLTTYKGEKVFHGGSYDIKQLVWELWMNHPLDFKNLVDGTHIITNNYHDSLFVSFLCLNSTARPELGLKPLSYEYAGDYGEESIKDVRKIEPFQLLKYNLTDGCCTNFVIDKYWERMFDDEQEEVYRHFLDMQRVLTVTELHGLPMDEQQLIRVSTKFENRRDELVASINKHDLTEQARAIIVSGKVIEDNKKLKKIKRKFEDYDEKFEFNPNSSQQLAVLVHKVMGLPITKLTPTKEPKMDSDVLQTLIHKTNDPEEKQLLAEIIELSELSTVINTFIKAFKEGMLKADGRRYLHGNFNLARVKSGRLSSSDPNLQNIPANSTYGKDIKTIFVAPEGSLWVYSDFASLEDYISALLSKDPNKLKVYLGHEIYSVTSEGIKYLVRDDSNIVIQGAPIPVVQVAEQKASNFKTVFDFDKNYNDLEKDDIVVGKDFKITKVGNSQGYDGHALRAYSYFYSSLSNYKNTVNGINQIKKDDRKERGKSKGPTFQLTYGGTYFGLMDKFGFTEKEAKAIDTNYHSLYIVSDLYKEKRLAEAASLGYMTLAFGLRIRCPLLKGTIRNSRWSAIGTKEDERTLGNAMGQSYGMLNNRAMIEFMDKVWSSKWRYKIMPMAPIHDASYYCIPDDVEAIKFTNDNLIKAMQWQEDPAIAHDRVKIGGELDIAYPSWRDPVTIPNSADEATIERLCKEHQRNFIKTLIRNKIGYPKREK